MSGEITTLMKDTYNAGIDMLAQQMDFRLKPFVTHDRGDGERKSFQQIGLVSAKRKTERHSDTQYINTPHRRRWVYPNAFEFAELMDLADMLRIVSDPGGAYGKSMLASINRDRDADIITAALGTALTGKEGTTSTVLPAAQQIAAGGTGFTLAKVEDAYTILATGEAFDAADDLVVAWTRDQEEEFLGTTEVKSVDYNTQRVLLNGTMGDGKFYGFRYVRLEDWTDEESAAHQILPKVSTTRSCVAWVKSGLLHATWRDPVVKIDPMPGKNHSQQYWIGAQYGSARMQETKVVQIDVVEAA